MLSRTLFLTQLGPLALLAAAIVQDGAASASLDPARTSDKAEAGAAAPPAPTEAPLSDDKPDPVYRAAPVRVAEDEPAILFAEADDEQVLSRVASVIEDIDTLRARFTQTAPSGAVTSGTISLDRPGRLRFDYDAPSAQQIVATGGLVYVHDDELETTDSYPVGQTPLRFLLSDSIDADGVRLTGVTRRQDEVAVALQAADDELSGEVALVFTGTEDELSLDRWAVVDPQGGVTIVELAEVETGVDLSRRLFRIPEAPRRFGNDRR